INSELFLVRQLSVICARSHDVRSWLGELCCRDGFAVFYLNGGGIKRDRRRPAPEQPIDTESLLALTTPAGVPTASTSGRDVDRRLRLVGPGFESGVSCPIARVGGPFLGVGRPSSWTEAVNVNVLGKVTADGTSSVIEGALFLSDSAFRVF